MKDEEIIRIIKIVADRAWDIAYEGKAPDGICWAIEDLSDDPKTRNELLDEIKRELAL
ncbi:MAG: hypothetical protein WC100_19320 [Sterolibacterium sp.]